MHGGADSRLDSVFMRNATQRCAVRARRYEALQQEQAWGAGEKDAVIEDLREQVRPRGAASPCVHYLGFMGQGAGAAPRRCKSVRA